MNIDAIRPKIFSARKIVTMTNNVEPEAFATLGERIVATGSAADLSMRFKDATRVDFGGATIVPGFNDSHMHLAMTAEDLLHVDVFPRKVPSLAALKTRLREEVERVRRADGF